MEEERIDNTMVCLVTVFMLIFVVSIIVNIGLITKTIVAHDKECSIVSDK